MPGPFVLSVEERKILAPDALSFGDLPVDFWDVDDESGTQFYVPVDPVAGIFFCGDTELFPDFSVAVLSDPIAFRLVTWDYTESTPTYTEYGTSEFPNMLEGDYVDNRLFVYCRNNGTSNVEVWDVDTWSIIDTFNTNDPDYPFMSDMDFDPHLQQFYLPSGTGGDFEVWETETYTYVQTITTGPTVVTGVDHMGGAIYVTVPDHLLVYDAETLALLWDLPVPGANLRNISCNPNTHKMYVPDMGVSVYVFQLQ
jgi:WD40 repeat protein